MANKNPTKTSFGAGNQPNKRRGKSERTKILESFERESKTEDGFYDLLTTKAFNPEDQFSFKELLNRLSPMPKAVAPTVNFEFDPKASLTNQSAQVLTAISNGDIPPDLGGSIINSISSLIKIKEVTEIEERLAAMEARIEQDS